MAKIFIHVYDAASLHLNVRGDALLFYKTRVLVCHGVVPCCEYLCREDVQSAAPLKVVLLVQTCHAIENSETIWFRDWLVKNDHTSDGSPV